MHILILFLVLFRSTCYWANDRGAYDMEVVPARHEGARDVKGYTISHAYIYVLTAWEELIHCCVRILLCLNLGGSITSDPSSKYHWLRASLNMQRCERFDVSKRYVLIGRDRSIRSQATVPRLFLTHVEIVLYRRKVFRLTWRSSKYRLGPKHKDRKVTHESHGVVIDDGASTNEAIPPLVLIGRGKVNLGRVSLEQWRDIVLSGSSRFNH